MRWLLDTNVWISFLKPGNPHISDRIVQCDKHSIVLCSIVKAELWHGAYKYGNSERRLERLDELFAHHASFPFDDQAAWHYGRIRHELEVAGLVIGPNDLKIASICLAQKLTLVTANVNEFSRISGLPVDDWSKPPGDD